MGLEESHWALRIKSGAAVLHNNPADNCVDVSNLTNRDDRHEVVMLLIFVQGIKIPKMFVRSVFRAYLFKKEFCKTGDGLLYRRETSVGYEIFPFRDWEVEIPRRPLAPSIYDRNCGVIEGLPDIVEGIPDDASKRPWDILFGPEGYAVSGRVQVNHRSALFVPRVGDFVQVPVQWRASLPEFINVAVGPLNL